MHARIRTDSDAGTGPADRGGSCASPSGGPDRRRFRLSLALRPGPTAFKPVTYAVMHLSVAIGVAYALTRDWRIALGVGIIEPMVQTLAYMIHEKAWSIGGRRRKA